jgi:hypothetical protein
MTNWNTGIPVGLEDLPQAATTYIDAHDVRDVPRALSAFARDAQITDEGRTYRGNTDMTDWLANSATEWTYTSETISATRIDDEHYDVIRHLEGDFPGGTADLHFRFTLAGDTITSLIIEP